MKTNGRRVILRKRRWGLFEKEDGKFIRLYEGLSLPKADAVRVFQNKLLDGIMLGKDTQLRPVE